MPISRETRKFKLLKKQGPDERDMYRDEILDAALILETQEKLELDSVGRSTLVGQ